MYGQIALYQDIPDDTTVQIDLGQFNRFGARGGRCQLWAAAELINQLRATLKFGSTDALTRGFVPVAATAGRVSDIEDRIAHGFGAPLDPITLTVENIGTAAAACEIYAKLAIN